MCDLVQESVVHTGYSKADVSSAGCYKSKIVVTNQIASSLAKYQSKMFLSQTDEQIQSKSTYQLSNPAIKYANPD